MLKEEIKKLAKEKEKYVTSIKVLEKVDNVSDVQLCIDYLKEKIKSINIDIQQYIYCTTVTNDDVLKWLDDNLNRYVNEALTSDCISDYIDSAIMVNKILADLSLHYSIINDNNDSEPYIEENDEILESLPDEEDHDEYIRMLFDDLPHQSKEPNYIVKETDPDED